MKRVTTKTSANAVHLAPLVAEWQGTGTPVLLFGGRRGQIMQIDVYDNPAGNYNVAIAGTSGSGKSLLLNEIAAAYLGTGARVWIIDVGRSYEKACRNFGGSFIEFTEDAALSLNPFPWSRTSTRTWNSCSRCSRRWCPRASRSTAFSTRRWARRSRRSGRPRAAP